MTPAHPATLPLAPWRISPAFPPWAGRMNGPRGAPALGVGPVAASVLLAVAIWFPPVGHRAMMDAAKEEGEEEARRTAQNGAIVFRRWCFFPAASIVFRRRFGIECPLTDPPHHTCIVRGDVDLLQLARDEGYDEEMHRLASLKWSPEEFAEAFTEARRLQPILDRDRVPHPKLHARRRAPPGH